VAVALAALDGIEGVDGGHVALLGASHGAWAAMETIDRLGREGPPPGLTAWPEARETAAGRLQGAVLLYPYCGLFNRAAEWEPTHAAVPVLMVLAGADTIVSTGDCEAAATHMARAGVPVRVRTLPGVDHGFDQRLHAAFSTLEFDAAATTMAAELVTGFLAAPPAGGTKAP
jgi:dienelactone hydrolase